MGACVDVPGKVRAKFINLHTKKILSYCIFDNGKIMYPNHLPFMSPRNKVNV